jgi:hypothetical protein
MPGEDEVQPLLEHGCSFIGTYFAAVTPAGPPPITATDLTPLIDSMPETAEDSESTQENLWIEDQEVILILRAQARRHSEWLV